MKNCFLGALVLLLFACQSVAESQQDDPPNIILIIADDMNWDDCGAYGHPNIQTPNIDKLAEEGMRFDRAYITASSCSPSRASMIMGRYPHNTGAEQLHWGIPPGSPTFVEALKKQGYYTAAAGKWHMGDHIRHHFDKIYEANTAGFQLPSGDGKEPPKMIAQQPSGCEDWKQSLESRPKGQPFFMWFAALDPHRAYEDGILATPHKISDVIVPPYLPDTKEVREDFRLYYDEIGRLDMYIGKVMAQLKKEGIEDNTLIIFLSDNGRPFPRDKTTLYEGGIKTPFIVKWPGKLKAGTSTEHLISSIDIAPSILEVAGITPSSQYEGESFLPLLMGEEVISRNYVFAEDHWHDYEDHARAIISQDWKLIRNDYPDLAATPSADAGRSPTFQAMLKLKEQGELTNAQLACFKVPRANYELYNLKDDPFELHNLAEDPAHSRIKQDLIKALDDWGIETHDFMPSQRTPDEFDRLTGEPDHSVRKRPRPDKKAMFGTYAKY